MIHVFMILSLSAPTLLPFGKLDNGSAYEQQTPLTVPLARHEKQKLIVQELVQGLRIEFDSMDACTAFAQSEIINRNGATVRCVEQGTK